MLLPLLSPSSLAWCWRPRPCCTDAVPLTIENCGSTLTFAQAPARAVTIGQAGTEMLSPSDWVKKSSALSTVVHDVLPQYRAQNDNIERLADNDRVSNR